MLRDVLISDWMTAKVISATPDMPIIDAHHIMKEHGIRRLPVIKNGRQLVGIITIGDVREASPSGATTLSIWELNYLWSQIKVEDVMSRKVFTVYADEPLIKAAQIMLDKKVGGLPVLNNSDEVIGMLTESDIFRMLVQTQSQEIPKV